MKPSLPKNTPTYSFTHNYNLSIVSYHSISNNISNVIPCSIAACKSIGHISTDNFNHVLFDFGSSKTLIHACAVSCNYRPIQSGDD